MGTGEVKCNFWTFVCELQRGTEAEKKEKRTSEAFYRSLACRTRWTLRIIIKKDNEQAIYNILPAWKERGYMQHHLMHNLPAWKKRINKKDNICKLFIYCLL